MTKFAKLQAVGNDFLVLPVDTVQDPLNTAGRLARRMCHRHYGAGADGLILVSRAVTKDADFDSRIFNADGGEAEISGNGTRCLAAYLYHAGLQTGPDVRIGTKAGVKVGRLVSRQEGLFDFEFDMGIPRLASNEIPINIDPPVNRVTNHSIGAGDQTFVVTCTSMGNPHCSLFVNEFDDAFIDRAGPLIENSPLFPERTNVEFVKILSRDAIEVRYWERGVGRTMSSGTGSCGASVASAICGLTNRQVTVNTQGGVLIVDWRDDDRVLLTGQAQMIYQGEWLAG
ncbi:MAG TPA: diaminopimelate epimerase [Blastocatellia bacterium]|nr:diaminopimelate epimerase [Blastocatellia bacterium]